MQVLVMYLSTSSIKITGNEIINTASHSARLSGTMSNNVYKKKYNKLVNSLQSKFDAYRFSLVTYREQRHI